MASEYPARTRCIPLTFIALGRLIHRPKLEKQRRFGSVLGSKFPVRLWSAIITYPRRERVPRLHPHGCMGFTALDISPLSRENKSGGLQGLRGTH